VPTDVVDDFIAYMAFGGNLASREAKEYYEICSNPKYAVRHNEYTGAWHVPEKARFQKGSYSGLFREAVFNTYGTDRMNMLHVLENTLNMKTLTATDLKDPYDEKCRDRVLNKDETLKLIEKQKFMIETFQKWVWSDEIRKKRLQSYYCNRYGNNKVRVFDGSFLKLPGLNPDIELYDYQKDAVERIIMSPNTLLAHDVGAGKTYTMIAAGMELRRLDKSKKNLYVIPNGIIAQWERIFKMMYPQAKLLVVTIKVFDAKHKSETLQRIKDEDFDAILMTYSCFDMLSLSDRFYEELYQERIEMLRKAMSSYTSTGRIANKIDRINKLIENIKADYQNVRSKDISFDELGINTLFVDEAHNYKNIDLETKISRVRGVGGSNSKHGTSMMDKVHCVQRMNDGGRVVFATGTPVTNSLSDIFAMQKYLQEGELEFQGITTFD
jgi:N12 class adenine-specific DNA methylase